MNKTNAIPQKKGTTATTVPKSLKEKTVEQKPTQTKSDAPVVLLTDVLTKAGIKEEIAATFKRNKLTKVSDLFTKEGMDILSKAKVPATRQKKLLATAKFSLASGNIELSNKLVEKKISSFVQLSHMSAGKIEQAIGNFSKEEQLAVNRLLNRTSIMLQQMREVSIQIQRNQSRDSTWFGGSDFKVSDDLQVTSNVAEINDDPLYNVFSPIAYVLDLIGFLDNELAADKIEQILFQESYTLDCEKGMVPVLQIELGIEVLEKYLGTSRIPIQNDSLSRSYRDFINTLLAIGNINPKNLPTDPDNPAFKADIDLATPSLIVINRVLKSVCSIFNRLTIENQYPSPKSDDYQTTEQLLVACEQIRKQRESAGLEFVKLTTNALFPLLSKYRDALIATTTESVEKLEQRLFIDLRSTPAQQTNRITQLIQSLQSLILSIRLHDILQHPLPWVAQAFAGKYKFDEATWTWLGEYATWSSAMYVLVYPENLVSLPQYRPLKTYAFTMATSSMPVPAFSQALNDAENKYDLHLDTVGKLKPSSAHTIDSKTLLFATKSGQLWMTGTYGQKWMGWQPVGECSTDLMPVTTVLYKTGNETKIFSAYDKIERSTDHINRSIYLFRVFPDGVQDSEPYLKLDIYKSTKEWMEDGREDVLSWSANGWYIETTHVNGRLNPLITIFGTLIKNDYTQEDVWIQTCIGLDDVLPDGYVPDWSGYSIANNPYSPGVIINHKSYRLKPAEQPGYYLLIKDVNPSVACTIRLIDLFKNDPEYLTASVGMIKGCLLATADAPNSEITLVVHTTSGSIFAVSFYEPIFDEGQYTYYSPPICVSAGRARLEMGLERMGVVPLQPPCLIPKVYFEERFLHLPLYGACILNRAGDYKSAHEWYRKLYDPYNPEKKYGFPFEEYFTRGISRFNRWVGYLEDPWAIAGDRKGIYQRHVTLMMVKNLLDWADHEFAQSQPEAINKARELYLLAKRILSAPELNDLFAEIIAGLAISIQQTYGMEVKVLIPGWATIQTFCTPGILKKTLESIKTLLKENKPIEQFICDATKTVSAAIAEQKNSRSLLQIGKLYQKNIEHLELLEDVLVESTFAGESSTQQEDPGDNHEFSFGPQIFTRSFSIPVNPLLKALSFHIDSSLQKIHNDFNIGGDFVMPSAPYPSNPNNWGGLQPPPNGSPEQPRYRYIFLSEKARQQANYAQQLGVELLQAYEKADAASFERLQAEHAIAIANATVSLKQLAVQEASDGKIVADQQKQRATIQSDFWGNRLSSGYHGGFLGFGVNGISEAEMTGMGLTAISGSLQAASAGVSAALILPAILGAAGSGVVSMIGGGAGLVTAETGVGAIGGAATFLGGAAGVATSVLAGGPLLSQTLSSAAGAAGTFGSLALTIASFQRRWEDWNLQYNLANIDSLIADLQITLSQDRIAIANQDQTIAQLQHDHAIEVLNFLSTKHSNTELYEWMRDVLLEQYRIIMQIATSTALLAQRSLEFERQENINIITDDYWSADMGVLSASNLTEEQKNSGHLGAERLMTALTQLDQYKLNNDRRLLQISKTISMARLMPTELVKLRETGKIYFNTLMDWFDWDFPGHYLRLIKSVKVTVLALVPPLDGIHAMLSNDGTSSVVVNENSSFIKKRAMRTYGESIALDAGYNETGLFVLDYNDPMFLPFEGLGVETSWTFEMPQATNRFDFNTIADVLLTIEYTAQKSDEYAQQVRTRLGNRSSAMTLIDIKQLYPDQWYNLKNPQRNTAGAIDAQTTVLNVPASLFPPNLSNPSVPHLSLIITGELAGADEAATAAIRRTLSQGILLEKRDKKANGNTNLVLLPLQFRDNYALFATGTAGMVVREIWHGINKSSVAEVMEYIKSNNSAPDDFEVMGCLKSGEERGTCYGSRIWGYLKVPTQGYYTFWLSSDDDSELRISTDSDPAHLPATPNASVPGWTNSQEWNKYPSQQKSKPIELFPDRQYFFEIIHRETAGGDHVELGWHKPGESGPEPSEIIPGMYLSPYCQESPTIKDPSGEWELHFSKGLFEKVTGMPDDKRTVMDRISDIMLALTIEGNVRW